MTYVTYKDLWLIKATWTALTVSTMLWLNKWKEKESIERQSLKNTNGLFTPPLSNWTTDLLTQLEPVTWQLYSLIADLLPTNINK